MSDMPTLPTVGGDQDTWGTELNEYLEEGFGPSLYVPAGHPVRVTVPTPAVSGTNATAAPKVLRPFLVGGGPYLYLIQTNPNPQTIPNETWTDVTWDSANVERGAEMWSTANRSTWTAPRDGQYVYFGKVVWEASTVGVRKARFFIIGLGSDVQSYSLPTGQTDVTDVPSSGVIVQGTQLKMQVWQSSGGDLDIIDHPDGVLAGPQVMFGYIGPTPP